MKKILTYLLALSVTLLAQGQINVQKASGTNQISNGPVVVGNGNSISATGTGTITATNFSPGSQSANVVFAGPTTAPAAAPAFRALVDVDIPSALTGKTYNGLTVTSTTGTLTLTAAKVFSVTNTLTLSGTDGSTLNVGAGGTLGSNAFTSTAYAPIASPTFTGTVTTPDLAFNGTTTAGLAVKSLTTTQKNALTAAAGQVIYDSTLNRYQFYEGSGNAWHSHVRLDGDTMTGHLLFTDNTYDIGASGATRPRTGYFGTNVSSPIFTSTVATGTAPLTVASTTLVSNLHAATADAAPLSGVSGLGTGVGTALAVNVGTAGAVLVNGGVLGTPSSGTVTNLTGTASININGTVGATTPTTGAFTTLTSSGRIGINGSLVNNSGAYLSGIMPNVAGDTIGTGFQSAGTFPASFTNAINAFYSSIATTASAYTVGSVIGFHATDVTKGAGSTITTQYGLLVDNQTQGATNYAIKTGTGLVAFGDTTSSTSTTTGALTVAGGLGVAGAIYSGGNLTFGTSGSLLNGTTDSIGLTAVGTNQSASVKATGTGKVQLYGQLATGAYNEADVSFALRQQNNGPGNTYLGIGFLESNPNFATYLQTQRVNTGAAGFLMLQPGAGNVLIGLTTNITGTGGLGIGGTTEATTGGAGSLTTAGGIYAAKAIVSGSTTASTSTTTGALTVAGGLGVAGAAYIGGPVNVPNVAGGDAIVIGDASHSQGIQIQRGANTTYGNLYYKTGATSDWRLGLRENSDSDFHLYSYGTSSNVLDIARATGNVALAGGLTIAGTVIHTQSATPASASAAGTVGTIAWDASYIYVCTATNTWKRTALSTW